MVNTETILCECSICGRLFNLNKDYDFIDDHCLSCYVNSYTVRRWRFAMDRNSESKIDKWNYDKWLIVEQRWLKTKYPSDNISIKEITKIILVNEL